MIADLVRKLHAAGVAPEAIIIAVEAVEEMQQAAAEQAEAREEKRRAEGRRRTAEWRQRKAGGDAETVTEPDCDVTERHVMSRDVSERHGDVTPLPPVPPFPPLMVSPKPPSYKTPLPPIPPTASARARARCRLISGFLDTATLPERVRCQDLLTPEKRISDRDHRCRRTAPAPRPRKTCY